MADRWHDHAARAAEETGAPVGGGAAPVGVGGAPIPVLHSGDWAYGPRTDVWRPLSLIEAGTEIEDLTPDQLADMLDSGAEIPSWFASEAGAAELRHARPPRSERGCVLFLTGLSGSGKSTIARDLRDLLAERSDRRVSLLDGDLVRSLLSAGLTFSRADRDLNIARIGYVAAEIAKHGCIAICAPIAPFATARSRSGRWCPTLATSCSSTWPPRSRYARSGTARACTPRRGLGSSSSSPGCLTRMRNRPMPSSYSIRR